MRELLKNKSVVIAFCGVVIAALAFGTVLIAKNAMADPAKYIGVEKAKEIALTDADVKAKEATFTKTKLDKDDRVAHYDVEFYTAQYEYEYELDAESGSIIDKSVEKNKDYNKPKKDDNSSNNNDGSDQDTGSYDGNNDNSWDDDDNHYSGGSDSNYDSGGSSDSSSDGYIGVSKAKSIALSNAGLSSGQVTFIKANLDYDDGIYVYEIEFRKGGTEYEYEINAKTGKIISRDVDYEDDDDDDDDDDD